MACTLLRYAMPLVVRLNALTGDLGREDLAWLAGIPLIESVAGWATLAEVASAPGVVRLAVGQLDFMADTGIQCSDDEAELLPLRFAVTLQTRLHRLAPAIDGVTARFDDDERLHSAPPR